MPDLSQFFTQLFSASLRPAWEVLALILTSALMGFLIARTLYRSKVATRTDLLRFEQTRWRRRMSQSSSSVALVVRDRDRSQRKLRRARVDITKMSAAMTKVT